MFNKYNLKHNKSIIARPCKHVCLSNTNFVFNIKLSIIRVILSPGNVQCKCSNIPCVYPVTYWQGHMPIKAYMYGNVYNVCLGPYSLLQSEFKFGTCYNYNRKNKYMVWWTDLFIQQLHVVCRKSNTELVFPFNQWATINWKINQMNIK